MVVLLRLHDDDLLKMLTSADRSLCPAAVTAGGDDVAELLGGEHCALQRLRPTIRRSATEVVGDDDDDEQISDSEPTRQHNTRR